MRLMSFDADIEAFIRAVGRAFSAPVIASQTRQYRAPDPLEAEELPTNVCNLYGIKYSIIYLMRIVDMDAAHSPSVQITAESESLGGK